MGTYQRGFNMVILVLGLFIAIPGRVFALQTYGPPEGLYIHQMAHVFFAFAMISFLVFLRIKPLGTGKGWRYFRLTLVFFFLWNVNAFIAHTLEHRLPEEAIFSGGHLFDQYLISPLNLHKIFYYVGKFDHLLCVPAMVFFVLALKTFCREAERRVEAGSRRVME